MSIKSSGYRYYELSQANRAEAVRILRSVEMPLDQIRAILDADDPEAARRQLVMQRERLAQRLAAQERMLTYLEALINRREGIMPYDVQIIEEAPQQVAATKVQTTLAKVGSDIRAGFGTLVRALGKEGVSPSGAPMLLYHNVIDEATPGDIEICVPIDGSFTGDDKVYTRELEGGPMATTVHHGPYEEIAPAYHTVTAWISEHGHEIVAATREIYLNDPQVVPPNELLTRVQFPICGEPNA